MHLDRVADREQFFAKMRCALDEIGTFYAFERITLSPLEDGRQFLPLAKSGFCEERLPFICKTKSGDAIALRMSFPLSIARAYMNHKMYDLQHPLKLFTEGENFFIIPGSALLQSSDEMTFAFLGEEAPVAEAEIMQVAWKAIEKAGVRMESARFRVNATGCMECRSGFRAAFMAYLRSRAARLCKNCKRLLKQAPTKILWCQEEKCAMIGTHAPQILDFLCDVCKKHLRGLLEFLDEVRVPYFLDPKLFREGSWYGRIIFECVYDAKPENTDRSIATTNVLTLVDGGRVSRAVELMTGKRVEMVSGNVFFEAIEQAVFGSGQTRASDRAPVFLVQIGDLAKRKSLAMLEVLREAGIDSRESLGKDSIKIQLRVAERLGARVVLIIGQKEALDDTVIVREMDSGIQETLPQDKLIEFLKRKLNK